MKQITIHDGQLITVNEDGSMHRSSVAELRDEILRLRSAAIAGPGTIEIGVSPDETEVIVNLPYTPDNGSGYVHYVFTPDQARHAGRSLIDKADECK